MTQPSRPHRSSEHPVQPPGQSRGQPPGQSATPSPGQSPDSVAGQSADPSAGPRRPTGWPADADLLGALSAWMPGRRWFPLKGVVAPDAQALRVVSSWEMAPGVRDLVVAVPRGEPAASGPGERDLDAQDPQGVSAPSSAPAAPVLVHVPLVLEEAARLDRFAVEGETPGSHGLTLTLPGRPGGPGAEVALVDGPHHPAFWQAWARGALEAGTVLDEAGTQAIIQRARRLRVSTSQQSNTSVVLPAPSPGEQPGGQEDAATGDLVVKLIRVLDEGRNPDVEVPVALARHGWDRVRRPVAWSVASWDPPRAPSRDRTRPSPPPAHALADSAVACAFVPEARDGFELFCELAAHDDSEGPMRQRALALAHELGGTTAQMHAHLASALGTSAPQQPRELAQALRRRAYWALAEVPELGRRLPGLADQVDQFLSALEGADLEELGPATRIHGDYHLGQVLRETGGRHRWLVLDFEGEPLRPLAQRTLPDQPLRDVAGMLRSFDYAAAVGRAAHAGWLPAVRDAFTTGYLEEAGGGPHEPQDAPQAGQQIREEAPPGGLPDPGAATGRRPQPRAREVLLACLELDKALYEAVYEARNRPDWLDIPVSGIDAILETRVTPGRLSDLTDDPEEPPTAMPDR